MNAIFSRENWTDVLERMRPFGMNWINDKTPFAGISDETLYLIVDYLSELGYVKSRNQRSLDGIWNWGGVSLTAQGIDYLSDDGGLTAKSKIITIRLDGETIKNLICAQIDQQDAAEGDKSKIKHKVRALGAEALKDVTDELVKLGLRQSPHLLQWLGTVFG